MSQGAATAAPQCGLCRPRPRLIWAGHPAPLAGQDLEPVVELAGKGAGLGMEGEQESSQWGRLVRGSHGVVPKAVPLMLFQPH